MPRLADDNLHRLRWQW